MPYGEENMDATTLDDVRTMSSKDRVQLAVSLLDTLQSTDVASIIAAGHIRLGAIRDENNAATEAAKNAGKRSK